MLTDAEKQRVADYLGLALGLFLSVQFPATCNEYEVRNGFSRLYYAFFHVSLAFLLSRGEQIDNYRWYHGDVHTAVGRGMGKYFSKFFRELYGARRGADYEPAFFDKRYGR